MTNSSFADNSLMRLWGLGTLVPGVHSTTTLVGVTVLLLLSIIGITVWWPKLARTRLLTVFARLLSLLLVVVLSLAVTGVFLNREYGFYDSWTDVWQDIHNSGIIDDGPIIAPTVESKKTLGAKPNRVFEKQLAIQPYHTLPKRKNLLSTSTPTSYTVDGKLSGVSRQVVVALPPNYDPTKTYPVVVALHGSPGTPTQVLDSLDLVRTLQTTADAGKIVQPIIVAPETKGDSVADTECADTPDSEMETFLSADLTQWVKKHYRVYTSPAAWNTLGISEGGWCATMLTMLHPNTFGSTISLGGYYTPQWSPVYTPWEATNAAEYRYNLADLARSQPPLSALYATTGENDKWSGASTEEFAKSITSPTSLTLTTLKTGGHRMTIWLPQVGPALEWLGENNPYFQPNVFVPTKKLPPKKKRIPLPTIPTPYGNLIVPKTPTPTPSGTVRGTPTPTPTKTKK